jgi:uncharacterized protein (UPF0210 family)
MTNSHQKHQILESIEALDQTQAEQVLAYIQGLVGRSDEAGYQKLKREAMKEIRQALGKGRKLNPAF